jgi:tRNA (guanine37-N1)-methyltransferase
MLGCTVYANDINPECYKWMNINLKKNQPKKSPREYHVFNLDGREFLRTIALPRIESYQKEVAEKRRDLSKSKIVILMNLPELALTFLDVVSQWLSTNREEKEQWIIPIQIYCYTFSRAEDRVEDVRMRLKTILPEINTDEVACRFVRQVAPNKDMMCVNIHLFETKEKDDQGVTVKRFKQNTSE